jgi:hypothetical protein
MSPRAADPPPPPPFSFSAQHRNRVRPIVVFLSPHEFSPSWSCRRPPLILLCHYVSPRALKSIVPSSESRRGIAATASFGERHPQAHFGRIILPLTSPSPASYYRIFLWTSSAIGAHLTPSNAVVCRHLLPSPPPSHPHARVAGSVVREPPSAAPSHASVGSVSCL